MAVKLECYSCDYVGLFPTASRWQVCPECCIAGHLHPASDAEPLENGAAGGESDVRCRADGDSDDPEQRVPVREDQGARQAD